MTQNRHSHRAHFVIQDDRRDLDSAQPEDILFLLHPTTPRPGLQEVFAQNLVKTRGTHNNLAVWN